VINRIVALLGSFALATASLAWSADVAGSQDPPGVKRYTGSEIIGYHAPSFDEFLLPLGPPTSFSPAAYAKSLKVEGLLARYTYVAPAGRTAAELFQNYEREFERLRLVRLYRKGANEKGWFGPTLEQVANADDLRQILAYNEAEERVLVAKSADASPTYYYLFVTTYRDGVIPERLANVIAKDRALAELIVIAPQPLEHNMTLLNAEDMSTSLASAGKVVLYGINFDTDKDSLRADSEATLKEIAKLLNNAPALKLHVVGHTDNQGTAEYNLDLSRRRAAAVVRELVTNYSIGAERLDSFGCGPYAPVALNDNEDGRARNRRVELIR